MTRIMQAAALTVCLAGATAAQDLGPVAPPPAQPPQDAGQEDAGRGDRDPEFSYTPPVVEQPLFSSDIKMLREERDQYATNLATYAAKLVVEGKASEESLAQCRRMLALAMHLSPRNRQALIVNGQLKQGVIPRAKKSDYSASVLSRLLMSRSLLLSQGDKPDERLLARCFVEMAATLDPRNEDAVFALEIQRLDHGDIDWEALMESRKPEQESTPAAPAGGTEGP